MADITVTNAGDDTFRVEVDEDGSSSEHLVRVGEDDVSRAPEGATAEDLVEASFRFLLDRERKESILSRFELDDISRYFPEYREKIGDYL